MQGGPQLSPGARSLASPNALLVDRCEEFRERHPQMASQCAVYRCGNRLGAPLGMAVAIHVSDLVKRSGQDDCPSNRPGESLIVGQGRRIVPGEQTRCPDPLQDLRRSESLLVESLEVALEVLRGCALGHDRCKDRRTLVSEQAIDRGEGRLGRPAIGVELQKGSHPSPTRPKRDGADRCLLGMTVSLGALGMEGTERGERMTAPRTCRSTAQ